MQGNQILWFHQVFFINFTLLALCWLWRWVLIPVLRFQNFIRLLQFAFRWLLHYLAKLLPLLIDSFILLRIIQNFIRCFIKILAVYHDFIIQHCLLALFLNNNFIKVTIGINLLLIKVWTLIWLHFHVLFKNILRIWSFLQSFCISECV